MKRVRCAIYTRKSSEDGLEQEFNLLYPQREACTAYIASQKHEGWVVPHRVVQDAARGAIWRSAARGRAGGHRASS